MLGLILFFWKNCYTRKNFAEKGYIVRTLISMILVAFLTLSLVVNDASAKRFGGGRSIGVQRTFSRTSHVQNPAPFKKSITSNRWFGPLAGLITGGLLASLFMGHGFGTGILMWLVVGALIFAILNLFRKRTPTLLPESAGSQTSYATQDPFLKESLAHFGSHASSTTNKNYEKDQDSFLQEAKAKFIRLQTAYDQKNLNDIRSFTTPEMFAEIQLQIFDRGESLNVTEVVSLNAQMLASEIYEHENPSLTSVEFSGLIRENSQQNAEPFKEVWNFCKDPQKQTWLVAGIQQANS